MKRLWVVWLAVAMSLVMATPAHAVKHAYTKRDPRGDVKIVHSGFAGNKDIDIRKAHYQYYGYRSRYDLTIELTLRRVRPDLETAQLYTTQVKVGGVRYRVYGNDGRGGSLYVLSNGTWTRVSWCEVYVTLHPSPSLVASTNVHVRADGCWKRKRLTVQWTKTENYYSDSMADLAAWDRVAVTKRVGKP